MSARLIPTVNSPSLKTEESRQLDLNFEDLEYESTYDFSPFIVYVDESGTANFDKSGSSSAFPVFVLAFCVFYKTVYSLELVPEIQSLKFKFFGHDLVILHEKEIRKKEGPFHFKNKKLESLFSEELNQIMNKSKFILISTIIDKRGLAKTGENLYHKALQPCLVNLYKLMIEKGCANKKTFVIVESRGNKEDKDLELEFRRICDGNNIYQKVLPFEILIKKKDTNATGLQFADLCARPIGRHILDKNKEGYKGNRAFNSLTTKFLTGNGRNSAGIEANYINHGLTIISK